MNTFPYSQYGSVYTGASWAPFSLGSQLGDPSSLIAEGGAGHDECTIHIRPTRDIPHTARAHIHDILE